MMTPKSGGKLRETAAMVVSRWSIGAGFGDQYGRTRWRRQFTIAGFSETQVGRRERRAARPLHPCVYPEKYRLLVFVTQSTIGACHGHGNLGSKRA
jgi:hypothetical protein